MTLKNKVSSFVLCKFSMNSCSYCISYLMVSKSASTLFFFLISVEKAYCHASSLLFSWNLWNSSLLMDSGLVFFSVHSFWTFHCSRTYHYHNGCRIFWEGECCVLRSPRYILFAWVVVALNILYLIFDVIDDIGKDGIRYFKYWNSIKILSWANNTENNRVKWKPVRIGVTRIKE